MIEGPLMTERLSLRSLELSDARRTSLLVGDWEVSRMLAAVPHPYDEAMAKDWIGRARRQLEAGDAYHFAIERREDELVVGTMGLVRTTASEAELGYWLGRPYWGYGYATEAAGRVIQFAFVGLELDRIVSAPLPSNTASIGVLGKLGFTFQGTEKQEFPAHGQIKEVSCFALTRAEYSANRRD